MKFAVCCIGLIGAALCAENLPEKPAKDELPAEIPTKKPTIIPLKTTMKPLTVKPMTLAPELEKPKLEATKKPLIEEPKITMEPKPETPEPKIEKPLVEEPKKPLVEEPKKPLTEEPKKPMEKPLVEPKKPLVEPKKPLIEEPKKPLVEEPKKSLIENPEEPMEPIPEMPYPYAPEPALIMVTAVDVPEEDVSHPLCRVPSPFDVPCGPGGECGPYMGCVADKLCCLGGLSSNVVADYTEEPEEPLTLVIEEAPVCPEEMPIPIKHMACTSDEDCKVDNFVGTCVPFTVKDGDNSTQEYGLCCGDLETYPKVMAQCPAGKIAAIPGPCGLGFPDGCPAGSVCTNSGEMFGRCCGDAEETVLDAEPANHWRRGFGHGRRHFGGHFGGFGHHRGFGHRGFGHRGFGHRGFGHRGFGHHRHFRGHFHG